MTMITSSYTRLANTTAYTANDALSDSTTAPTCLTFAGCSDLGGGSGWVMGVTAIDSANQTTLPQLTLYIFSGSTAPTATNDNSAFALTDANAVTLVGAFRLDNFEALNETAGTNGNAKCETDPTENRPIAFTCGSGITDLYGLVKVENAYTPVASEVFTFRLHIVRD